MMYKITFICRLAERNIHPEIYTLKNNDVYWDDGSGGTYNTDYESDTIRQYLKGHDWIITNDRPII